MGLRTVYQIRYGLKPFFSELIQFEQLLGAGVAPEPVSILYHLRSVIWTYPWKGIKSGRVSEVNVQPWNSNIIFQTRIYTITYHIGAGEVFLPMESAAFIPVIQNALSLLFTEAKPLELFQSGGVWIKWKALDFAASLPLGLYPRTMLCTHQTLPGGGSRGCVSSVLPSGASRGFRRSEGGAGRRGDWHIHIERIGMVPISLDAQNGTMVHEKSYLIAEYQKGDADGAEFNLSSYTC